MLQLLIDVKKEIACNSEEVWYKLWRYDTNFNKYASTDEGRRKFIELFTVNDNKNSTILFGKLNSIYDQPTVIQENGTKIWYQNDKLHRIGKPAVIYPDGTKNGGRTILKLGRTKTKILILLF